LTKVDPTGPAHVTRLLNTVLAVVAMTPEDRIKKDFKGKADIKVEVKAETEGAEGGEGHEGGEEGAEDDDDDDEVPFREEIGWRETLGFIVMSDYLYSAGNTSADDTIEPVSTPRKKSTPYYRLVRGSCPRPSPLQAR
jgi:hypothetical protein